MNDLNQILDRSKNSYQTVPASLIYITANGILTCIYFLISQFRHVLCEMSNNGERQGRDPT